MSDESDRINQGFKVASLMDVFVMDTEKFAPIDHYQCTPDPPVHEDELAVREALRREFHRVYSKFGRKPSFYIMGMRAYVRLCLEMSGPNGVHLMEEYLSAPIVLDREAQKDRISGIFTTEFELSRVMGNKP